MAFERSNFGHNQQQDNRSNFGNRSYQESPRDSGSKRSWIPKPGKGGALEVDRQSEGSPNFVGLINLETESIIRAIEAGDSILHIAVWVTRTQDGSKERLTFNLQTQAEVDGYKNRGNGNSQPRGNSNFRNNQPQQQQRRSAPQQDEVVEEQAIEQDLQQDETQEVQQPTKRRGRPTLTAKVQ